MQLINATEIARRVNRDASRRHASVCGVRTDVEGLELTDTLVPGTALER